MLNFAGRARQKRALVRHQKLLHDAEDGTGSGGLYPPGASLRLQDIPVRLQQELGVRTEEDVVFTQTSASVNTYRDAVRFANGRELNLQELREGQRVRVLSLALAEPMPARSVEEPHALLYRVR